MIRPLLIFIAIFTVLSLGYQCSLGTVIETLVIDLAAVKPGVALSLYYKGSEDIFLFHLAAI